MPVKRMDNVGIVVEDLDAAMEFFTELGLELEGRAPIQGDWADGVTGLRDMRGEVAMVRAPAAPHGGGDPPDAPPGRPRPARAVPVPRPVGARRPPPRPGERPRLPPRHV